MKKVIPYTKDIVFKTNIATISSISLEHEEKVFDNEVTGEFSIFGDYKIHNDTTEKELFKYKLPFTIDFVERIEKDSVVIDIDDFTYEVVDNNTLRVNIKFTLNALEFKEEVIKEEEKKEEERVDMELVESQKIDSDTTLNDGENFEESFDSDSDLLKEIDEYISEERKDLVGDEQEEESLIDDSLSNTNSDVMEKENVKERDDEKQEEVIKSVESEFVIYHIHIVSENETLEDIMKKYDCTLDDLRLYNEINNINIGDKIIIPENNG